MHTLAPLPPPTADNGVESAAAAVVDIDVVAAADAAAATGAFATCDASPRRRTTEPWEWKLAEASSHNASNPDN